MRKTIFLLNIGRYEPEVTRLTYPFIKHYAGRIGAEIHAITERKFPDWPVVYEKLQIYELAQKRGEGWFLYIDSDALIHPETPDFTTYLPKGTVSFHSYDLSTIRFKADEYFYRDGRYIAPGNWFTIASDLCLDLWKPLDLSPQEAIARITPTVEETNRRMSAEHLVDDYALARNLARFGLGFKSCSDILDEHKLYHLKAEDGRAYNFFLHDYTSPDKASQIEARIKEWKAYGILDAN